MGYQEKPFEPCSSSSMLGQSRKLTGSLVHRLTGSLTHWLTDSLAHWTTGSLIGSLAHWFTGLLVHWLTGSLAHWPTGSLAHWLGTHKPVGEKIFAFNVYNAGQIHRDKTVTENGMWGLVDGLASKPLA